MSLTYKNDPRPPFPGVYFKNLYKIQKFLFYWPPSLANGKNKILQNYTIMVFKTPGNQGFCKMKSL